MPSQEEVRESRMVSALSCSCLTDEDCRYRMDNPRRGVAAIFNQQTFDSSNVNERCGSERDCESLRRSFTRMGFEVEMNIDLTRDDIEETLLDLKERDHSDCDSFVLVFMSHGTEGKLRCKDDIFDINLLWDNFTADQCPSLANKPKIFIIQACQGNKRQGCVAVPGPSESLEDSEHVVLVPSFNLPLRADFLVAFSTIPGFVSWRSPELGSWYIQTLCRELDTYAFSKDMLTLLTRVSHKVALHHTYTDPLTNVPKKQLPSFISMLIRELRFSKKTGNIGRKVTKRKRKRTVMDDSESDEDDVRPRSPIGRSAKAAYI